MPNFNMHFELSEFAEADSGIRCGIEFSGTGVNQEECDFFERQLPARSNVDAWKGWEFEKELHFYKVEEHLKTLS